MSPQYFLPSFQSIGLSVQEKKFKIYFEDDGCGSQPGFPVDTISASFDLQVTLILPTKFRINWHFGSGEVQNRFLRWLPWWTSWTSNLNNFRDF